MCMHFFSLYQRSLIVNLVISGTQKVSCCEENNGKFPILAQTESWARPDRTSISSQINALSSRKQSRDCLSVSERPDRLSICSQVPALSLPKPSFDTRTMACTGASTIVCKGSSEEYQIRWEGYHNTCWRTRKKTLSAKKMMTMMSNNPLAKARKIS